MITDSIRMTGLMDELAGILSRPGLPVLPGYTPLSRVSESGPEPYRGGAFDERTPVPIPVPILTGY